MFEEKFINKIKSERGMTNVQLALTVIVVLLIAGFTIFLALGENGFSVSPKIEEQQNKKNENTINTTDKEEKETDNTVYGN